MASGAKEHGQSTSGWGGGSSPSWHKGRPYACIENQSEETCLGEAVVVTWFLIKIKIFAVVRPSILRPRQSNILMGRRVEKSKPRDHLPGGGKYRKYCENRGRCCNLKRGVLEGRIRPPLKSGGGGK